jgi:hypothetical protein
VHYEIRVGGVLDDTSEPSDVTRIAGPIVDDAALHGVLTKIRDLGLPLLSVTSDGAE